MKKRRIQIRPNMVSFEPTAEVRQQLAEIEAYAKSINPNISRRAILSNMVRDLHRQLCAAHRLPLATPKQVLESAVTAGKNGNGNASIDP